MPSFYDLVVTFRMRTTNPFPGLYLGNIGACQDRADSFSLGQIDVRDPELKFVLERQAKAKGGTVEDWCKANILTVLENAENESRGRLDDRTGQIRVDWK
jgi:hypothetical protein